MNTSGEAAEQIVRMSLNGVEVAAKITGKGSLKIASILLKEMQNQKHSKGKQRHNTMLRSGKPIKVYPVQDSDLTRFAKEAKKYGVPYCVLKDRDVNDGVTDIMVCADDDSKINRIFERFNLSKVSSATIETELERKQNKASEIPVPEKTQPEVSSKDKDFLNELMRKPAPNHEVAENRNPTEGRNAKARQSETSSKAKEDFKSVGGADMDQRKRPSVRKELKEIRREMEQKTDKSRGTKNKTVHKEPKKKKTKSKER